MAARCWCRPAPAPGRMLYLWPALNIFILSSSRRQHQRGACIYFIWDWTLGQSCIEHKERDRVMVGGVVTLGCTSTYIYSEYIWEHFDSQMYLADLKECTVLDLENIFTSKSVIIGKYDRRNIAKQRIWSVLAGLYLKKVSTSVYTIECIYARAERLPCWVSLGRMAIC